MKKTLLITLCIIFIVYLLLFVIQIIDEKVNGEDYEKIHRFTTDISSIIKSDSYCTQNSDDVFKMMFYDDYTNPNVAMDENSFKRRIESCKELIRQIDSVEVPDLKSKRKHDLAEALKKSSVLTLNNYTNYFRVYNNCPARNSSCMANYNETPNQMWAYGEFLYSSLQLSLRYSIKHIFFARPLLFWFKHNYSKNLDININ